MLTVFENAVTADEMAYLQQKFTEMTDQLEDEYFITCREVIHDLHGKDNETLVQQQRVNIRVGPLGDFVRSIVNRILPNPLKETVSIWFSRSIYPVGIHTDTNETSHEGHTLMIPMTFDDGIKTLVWKETAVTVPALNDIFCRFQTNIRSFQPQPRISNKLDVRNCWLTQPSIVDFLELDGMASWQTGSVFKFERKQLHASNNYREYVDFKDYILIHNDE